MQLAEIQTFLRKSPFFLPMTDDQLRLVAEAAELVSVPAGRRIITIGEPALRASVIHRGAVQLGVFRGDRLHLISTLGPGDFLGWSSVIPPHTWNYDAVANTDAEFVSISGERLCQLADEDPVFGIALMTCVAKAVTQRLAATRMALIDTYC